MRSFPLGTPNEDLIDWRKRAAAELELRYGGKRPILTGTFAADAERYLRAVKALDDYDGRVYQIELWIAVFGTRRRDLIKPSEIRQQRDAWLTRGPRRRYVKGKGWMDLPEPLSPQTVCLRMRALENLFTVLDGPHAYNPVREVQEPQTPKAKPRAIPYALIEAILAAMPDRGRGIPGKRRSTVSKTKARIRLMAFTGLTHSQVMQLTAEHFRLSVEPPEINRPARGKGAGAEGGWKSVPSEARAAIEAFIAADAWGDFSASAMWSSFQRACRKLELPDNLTPYQMRHSFGRAMLKLTGDLEATRMLMDHADVKTTLGYAQEEVDAWLRGVVAKVTRLTPANSSNGQNGENS